MTAGLRRVSATVLLLVALGAAGVVYYPVTRTYFFADDFVCLLRIVEWRLVHFLMAPFGGHILLVRGRVFYLWYVAFGLWPETYYWAVFVTHLINVWLLFRLIRPFTGDPAL